MIVETFWVKPTGFLASKRYVNVVVSDDGVVTRSNVPGKEVINRPFVSDYRTNNRSYNNGDLITTFCNFNTFTRINVYAQDETPFAYVTTGLDDTTCGFQTPLPTPAVPPNPFGTVAYGEYRFMNYCDDNGIAINISIEKKNFEGEPTEIFIGDKQTVKLSYKEVDNKFAPIRPLECTLGFINNENFLLSEFYTEDERTFRVTVTKDDVIKFKGYIIPDSCSEPFNAPPYPVSIKCTDALGSLKTVTYPFPVGGTFDLRQSFVDVLAYCFSPLNLNLDIVTICNLYEAKMPNSLNDDPLSMTTFNPLRLADDSGKVLTVYDTLVEIAKAWGAYIVQSNGKWCFVRANEPSQLVVRQRTYNYTGLFLAGENVANNRVVSKYTSQDLVALKGSNIQIQNAYKRVLVFSDFGKVPSVLYNGDFEAWNGFNFPYWTRYGGIDISRIQRSVRNSNGQETFIQNYALQFNQRALPSRWLEHDDVPIQQGDTVKVSYRVSNLPTDPNIIIIGAGLYFKMRIKLGEYYLFNKDGGNTYEWVKSLAFVGNKIQNSLGNLNTFTFGFQIPEAPVTGAMVVQLYGFDTTLEFTEPYDVNIPKVSLDDLTFTKTSQSGDNDVIGILNITDNARYFTQTPEKINILFGDYFLRVLSTDKLDNLYALYYGLDFTTGWVDFGISGKPIPFGLALAKSIIRAYKRPFIYWNGDLQIAKEAHGFNYLDVMNFDVPNEPNFNSKRFAFLGGDIDLKNNIISSARLAEIFDASGITIDNSVPYYPNMPEPIFVQDAQYTPIEGVFTDEFTTPFN